MTREKKKRMQPRHVLTAAVLLGVIPEHLVEKDDIIPVEELKKLDEQMSP